MEAVAKSLRNYPTSPPEDAFARRCDPRHEGAREGNAPSWSFTPEHNLRRCVSWFCPLSATGSRRTKAAMKTAWL